jgi:hypothetical protein
MLTTAAPLVKLAPDTTPEQQCGVRDIDQALTIFWSLVERLRGAADSRRPIHHVEEMISGRSWRPPVMGTWGRR